MMMLTLHALSAPTHAGLTFDSGGYNIKAGAGSMIGACTPRLSLRRSRCGRLTLHLTNGAQR